MSKSNPTPAAAADADLPAPMTPPDADLRSFRFMPLDVVRLRDSNIAAVDDPELFRASVLSWCASWHRVPAGSLPDDDRELARLLGYGRDVECWRRVRAAGGLHGWVKCADGSFYHEVVAEEVRAAWARKQARRESGRRGNATRWGPTQDRHGIAGGSHEDRNCDSTCDGNSDRNSDRKDRTGQDREDLSARADDSADGVAAEPKPRATKQTDRPDAGAGFTAFWQAYPRRVARRAAEAAYAGALWRGATPETILAGLARAKFSPDQQFIPYPATWLNGGRWTDEAPARPAVGVSYLRGAL